MRVCVCVCLRFALAGLCLLARFFVCLFCLFCLSMIFASSVGLFSLLPSVCPFLSLLCQIMSLIEWFWFCVFADLFACPGDLVSDALLLYIVVYSRPLKRFGST